MKPRRTLPKKERYPADISNSKERAKAWRNYRDKLEEMEGKECLEDEQRRKWKESEEYASRNKLAEKFKKGLTDSKN